MARLTKRLDFDGRGLRHFAAQPFGQSAGVVGVNLCIVPGARKSDIAEALVDQLFRVPPFRRNMNDHAVHRLALARVAGHGIAVVEVCVLAQVEAHAFASVEAELDGSIRADLVDVGQGSIWNALPFEGCGELNPVADGKLPFFPLINVHPLKTARVVGDFLAVFALDGKRVFMDVYLGDVCVFFGLEPESCASPRVTDYIADFVLHCPLAVGAGQLVAIGQHGHSDGPSLLLRAVISVELLDMRGVVRSARVGPPDYMAGSVTPKAWRISL